MSYDLHVELDPKKLPKLKQLRELAQKQELPLPFSDDFDPTTADGMTVCQVEGKTVGFELYLSEDALDPDGTMGIGLNTSARDTPSVVAMVIAGALLAKASHGTLIESYLGTHFKGDAAIALARRVLEVYRQKKDIWPTLSAPSKDGSAKTKSKAKAETKPQRATKGKSKPQPEPTEADPNDAAAQLKKLRERFNKVGIRTPMGDFADRDGVIVAATSIKAKDLNSWLLDARLALEAKKDRFVPIVIPASEVDEFCSRMNMAVEVPRRAIGETASFDYTSFWKKRKKPEWKLREGDVPALPRGWVDDPWPAIAKDERGAPHGVFVPAKYDWHLPLWTGFNAGGMSPFEHAAVLRRWHEALELEIWIMAMNSLCLCLNNADEDFRAAQEVAEEMAAYCPALNLKTDKSRLHLLARLIEHEPITLKWK